MVLKILYLLFACSLAQFSSVCLFAPSSSPLSFPFLCLVLVLSSLLVIHSFSFRCLEHFLMYTKCSTNWVLSSAFDTYATGTADQRIQEGTGMCCFQSKNLHLGKVCNPLQLDKKLDKSTEIWRQKFHQIFLQVNDTALTVSLWSNIYFCLQSKCSISVKRSTHFCKFLQPSCIQVDICT